MGLSANVSPRDVGLPDNCSWFQYLRQSIYLTLSTANLSSRYFDLWPIRQTSFIHWGNVQLQVPQRRDPWAHPCLWNNFARRPINWACRLSPILNTWLSVIQFRFFNFFSQQRSFCLFRIVRLFIWPFSLDTACIACSLVFEPPLCGPRLFSFLRRISLKSRVPSVPHLETKFAKFIDLFVGFIGL